MRSGDAVGVASQFCLLGGAGLTVAEGRRWRRRIRAAGPAGSRPAGLRACARYGGSRRLLGLIGPIGACLASLSGCASTLLTTADGYYYHSELDYRIARPDQAWKSLRVEGARMDKRLYRAYEAA